MGQSPGVVCLLSTGRLGVRREAGLSQILLCCPEEQLGLTSPQVQTRMNGAGLNHRRGILSHNGLPTVSPQNSSRREKRRDLRELPHLF